MNELQQETKKPPLKQGGGKKLITGKRVLALILVAALIGGYFIYRGQGKKKTAETTAYRESQVEIRTITQSLSSSGTLQPANSYTVKTLLSAEVLSDTFEEGDLVTKDQLLYTLDSSDATSSQTQEQNSYRQAQNSYEQAVKGKYPLADMSGVVSEVYVNNGDSVSGGKEILKITGDNSLYMDFTFTYTNSSAFYVGQSALVYINEFEDPVSGSVVSVSSGSLSTDAGIVGTSVRVKAANPGLVTSSYTATATIGSYTSLSGAAIRLGQTSTVTATASGKISGLSLLPGDSVTSGQRICTISGDSVDTSIENARISLENAQTRLESSQTKLDSYNITAPISGTVVTKSAKTGDNIEGGASTGALCTIYDLSYLQMTMSIDELDIAKVAVGQAVQVTADAVEGKTYSGVVTRKSVAGTTSGGITTYPVTVRIDETEGLLPGMNVDAEIVIEQSENVLSIPSGAVNRGNIVLITADSPSAAGAAQEDMTDGYVQVQVTTGVSDDSYTEILSGLQEGDTVAYISTSSSNNMNFMMGMPGGGGGMPGGGGGGMPGGGGGGMPGGGGGGAPGGGRGGNG